ncbi:hypothetical protein A5814_001320 [Enterococcus faecium]|nr:hypothetical protein A5814_001320 [Enterococcus faecium]
MGTKQVQVGLLKGYVSSFSKIEEGFQDGKKANSK